MAKFSEYATSEVDTNMQHNKLVEHLNKELSDETVIAKIIESDTNYIKYADGTLQCWGAQAITPTSIDVPKSQVITFPTAFISTPIVLVTAQSSNPYNGARECTCIPNSITQATIYLTRADLTATNISWFAIGKWK
jgi:hypothetical protein